MKKLLLIISDLHVGKNDEYDIFTSPAKYNLFDSFISFAREQSLPVELVINGDFIDFLQLRPWNGINRNVAVEKMRQIVSGSAAVFRSLGSFLQDSRHNIKILLGNHDVELAYPEVGAVLTERILQMAPNAEDRVEILNKRTTYNPVINGVLLHIEHGNRGDLLNTLDYTALFRDVELKTNNFDYPPGTKFVNEIMNGFKENLRFIDILKPETAAIIVLLALRPQALQAVPENSRRVFSYLKDGIVAKLRGHIAGPPLGRSSQSKDIECESIVDAIVTALVEANRDDLPTPDDIQYFLETLKSNDHGDAPTFGSSLNKVQLKFLVAACRLLGLPKAHQKDPEFFTHDYPQKDDVKRAFKCIEGDVRIVVFGHTHEALKTEFPRGIYINSGTWANLLRLPEGNDQDLRKWLATLSDNSFEKTAYPTYVKIAPEEKGVTASLHLWTEGGEHPLWRKSIPR